MESQTNTQEHHNSATEWNDNKYFKRYRARKRLAAFGIFLASNGMWIATDKIAGEIMWHGKQTEVTMLSEEENYYTDNLWVVIPGLGVQSGEGIASVLEDTLEPTGAVAYVQYSDDGISPLELASDINKLLKERGATEVSFDNHSMGGSTMFRILPYLDKDIKVKNIIFDCSPFTIFDSKNSIAPLMGSAAPFYGGGLLTKALVEIINNTVLHENESLSIPEQVQDALRVTFTGSSPRLWANQMGILKKTVPYDYRKYIQKSTKIYYLMPDNPDADDTVETPASFKAMQDFFGGKVIQIFVNGGGHANPADRPGEYRAALMPYFETPYIEQNTYQKYRPKT